MADRDQMMRALRNAHDAGDIEAARRIAGMISALDVQPKENVIARTPDGGRVVEKNGRRSFVSDAYATSDPAIIARILEGEGVQKVVQSEFDRDVIERNPIAARVQEINRGAPLVGSYLDDAVGMVSPKAADAMRLTSDAMQRENPGQTAALNIGGAVGYGIPMAMGAAALAPAAAASKVASLAGNSRLGKAVLGGLLGAGAGYGEGRVYGYGEGTTPEERARNSRQQGNIGLLFGGAGGAVAPTVGEMFGYLAERLKGDDVAQIAKYFGVDKDTAKVLKTAFEQNDQTAFDRIMRAGSEATLADAGRSGSALLDAAAQTGGRPLNIVDSAVTARANRSAGLLSGALDGALGTPRGPIQTAREISENSRPVRQAAYDAAYNTPIDYAAPEGRAIEALLGRINPARMRDAVNLANDRLRWEGGARQIMAEIADDGTVSFREMPGVRQLDELKRALDQIAQNSVDQFGRATDGGMAANQARAIRDALVDATGGKDGTYAAALKVGGDKIELDRALDMGLRMMRDSDPTTGKPTTPEAVSEFVAGLSDDGKAAMRTGLRSYIDDLMGRVKMIASDPEGQEARQAYAALKAMSSENADKKLRALLGDVEYGKLKPAMDEALSSQAMKADVSRNSATAIRQSIKGTVDEITTPGLIGRLARGEPIEATKRLTQELLNTTSGADAARKEKIWSEIAQVLSERRGNKSAEAALRYVEKALAGQPLTQAEAALIARQVVVGLPATSSRAGNIALQ